MTPGEHRRKAEEAIDQAYHANIDDGEAGYHLQRGILHALISISGELAPRVELVLDPDPEIRQTLQSLRDRLQADGNRP